MFNWALAVRRRPPAKTENYATASICRENASDIYKEVQKKCRVIFLELRSIGGDLVRGFGGRGRRISAENFFYAVPSKMWKFFFGGGRGGLALFVNFNI